MFLVAEGTVHFRNRIEEGNEDIDVGQSRAAWTPVGWSGFLEPRRYSTTVVCKTDCRTLRLSHRALATLFAADPTLGAGFLELVLRRCLDVLAERRARIVRHSQTPVNFGQSLDAKGEEETYNRAPPPVMELFRSSAFFEVFEEPQLRLFAEAVESRYFCRGEPIVEQGSRDPGLWVLATGRVALNYRPAGMKDAFALRTLSNPGAVAALAGIACIESSQTSVQAMRDCTLYRIDPQRIQAALERSPRLALALVRRLLWLVASHLRAARAVFISRRFAQERLAIRNLLEQSCTQLSVNSLIHRLPHLLDSHLTLGDAFALLDRMADSPDELERSLAQLCQDLLGEVKREHEFFEALRQVYHAVVTAPPEMPPRDVRKLCARGFREAFGRIRYVIEGERHLPATPGHIFIFNHLKNHEYNTLPNNFQLTLDSHFVSAMILDRRYGDSGIRVVRHSRGTEYGHQAYYDRLGHIAVYTHESDRMEETEAAAPEPAQRVLRDRGPLPAGRHEPHSQPRRDQLLDRGLARTVQAGRVPPRRERAARAVDRADCRRQLRPAHPLDRLRRHHQAALQGIAGPAGPGRSRAAEALPDAGARGLRVLRRGRAPAGPHRAAGVIRRPGTAATGAGWLLQSMPL